MIGLLTGCETTGLSHRERGGVTYPNYVLGMASGTDGQPTAQPQVPLSLAVAQIGESAPSTILTSRLESSSLFRSVTPLPAPGEDNHRRNSETTPDYRERVEALCGLARTSGADYVFLCGGDVSTWENATPLKAFDLTIVGMSLIPSSSISAEGKAAGTLIDARTGTPVSFVNVESSRSGMTTTTGWWGKRNSVQIAIRNDLNAKLGDALIAKVEKLARRN